MFPTDRSKLKTKTVWDSFKIIENISDENFEFKKNKDKYKTLWRPL